MPDYMSESIDDQAARWAARSLSGDFSEADRHALEEWRQADARHRAAFEEYMIIADCSSRALREADSDSKSKVKRFAAPVARRKIWFAAIPAIAASILAVFAFNFIIEPPGAVERYATQKGEVSEITLADSSMIVLNTNTEVSVRYSKRSREVALVRGEALFEVERDPGRPFIVEASGSQARVLGTKFNVRAKLNAMVVSVLSGRVEVGVDADKRKASRAAPVVLSAGREVTVYDQGEMMSDIREFDPAVIASWRQGVARYENEALSEVVTDLNRYFKTRIVLGDDSLNDIPVTGGFDLKNQDVAVEALSVALNLRAERRGSSVVVLLPYE